MRHFTYLSFLFTLVLVFSACATTVPLPAPFLVAAEPEGENSSFVGPKLGRYSAGLASFDEDVTDGILGSNFTFLSGKKSSVNKYFAFGHELGLMVSKEENNASYYGGNVSLDILNLTFPFKGTLYFNFNPTAAIEGGVNPYIGAGLGAYAFFAMGDATVTSGSSSLSGSDSEIGFVFGGHAKAGIEFFFQNNKGFFLEVELSKTSDADFWGVDFDYSHTLIHGGFIVKF